MYLVKMMVLSNHENLLIAPFAEIALILPSNAAQVLSIGEGDHRRAGRQSKHQGPPWLYGWAN